MPYNTLQMDKNTLRKKMKRKRDRLAPAVIKKYSKSIFNHFTGTFYPLIEGKGAIVVYLSTRSEVRTKELISFLLEQKARLYTPCIDNFRIVPSLLTKGCRLVKGAYGIYEPAIKKKAGSLKNIAAVIAPGIAFDMKGNRLGFGRGYFDRFLKRLPKKAVKVALAFSSQVVKAVPSARHDVKMDYIITEKGVFQM